MKKKTDTEFNKAWKDAKEKGLGVFDPVLKLRIEADRLAFIGPTGKEIKVKPRKELQLRRDLMLIEKVYKEKFAKCMNPYCLELFKEDEGLFVERLIRAAEICTLKYVLNCGGALNINKRPSIVKGRRNFIWED